jgi:formate C-acetyltransferase
MECEIMDKLNLLKDEFAAVSRKGLPNITDYLMYLGYREHYADDSLTAKAYAISKLFTGHEKYIYDSDLIAGSIYGKFSDKCSGAELAEAAKITGNYGKNYYWTNVDHFAADYETPLAIGIGGMIEKIKKSIELYKSDEKKRIFLNAALITMTGFSQMIRDYGEAARKKAEETGSAELFEAAEICSKIAVSKPESFREALQLVWLIHLSFLYENRYAMALGRLDQYLYPFYRKDIENGVITRGRALELIECTLYKIYECNVYTGNDDVVNIAIGGITRSGGDAVNELTYIILEAVKNCAVPGPNLSARISRKNPDKFLDECLKVIGTGIGYPALMNDEVNVAALSRYGYDIEDCLDYAMVGCIENFIAGKQPPWCDSRYNSPIYLDLTLNNGVNTMTGVKTGAETGDVSQPGTFGTMEQFLDALKTQMAHGLSEHMRTFINEASRYDKVMYSQPYLSCYCRDCIGRGLDIRDGGTIYPSVHSPCCMGIGTFTDSLAAIEQLVYKDKIITLAELRDILSADFEGSEDIRGLMLKAPKYGNNDGAADKFAQWFVDTHYELYSKHRTYDGGGVYVAIASNINNIPSGKEVAATPDGRKRGMPISDASSPTHGMDKNGITALMLSCSKPDFTKSACGTVLNIKFGSNMLKDRNREKIAALMRVYFERGGQEAQINCVSKEILEDASANPENYRNLVVRVSGFSAYYTALGKDVQQDILERTEYA